MRRATGAHRHPGTHAEISIHALHEESDAKVRILRAKVYISIHALHEESDRGDQVIVLRRLRISIHALHEESDLGFTQSGKTSNTYFNPRSP